VLWVHDELVACCRPDQVGEIMVRHAREAGAFYNFRVPLDADYKIGRSWAGEAIDGKAGEPQPIISPTPPIQREEPALSQQRRTNTKTHKNPANPTTRRSHHNRSHPSIPAPLMPDSLPGVPRRSAP
jgi:hypothetical protein